MHAARRSVTAATVAIAAAAATGVALTAANPARHHDLRLVDAAQYVYDLGQSEIATGTALYNQGDYTTGLQDIEIGQDNVVVDSPQDALLEQIETPTQPYEYVVTDAANIPIPTSAAQLSADLQLISEIGQNTLSQSATDLAAGNTNLGLAEFFIGTDDLSVSLPQAALDGPTYINIANTGDPLGIPANIYGLIDPASFGNDSLGYLNDAVETEVIGPITTYAEVSGIDLGPVGGLLSAADAAHTVDLFSEHWNGYLDGNFGDAAHIGLETSQLLFTAAGALTQDALPEVAVPLDAIATGLGGLDSLLTNAIGY